MNGLLQERFRAQVRARPSAIALVSGAERWTYAEVAERTNRLAHALRAHGLHPGDRVGILLSKTPAAILAILACVEAGLVYVPLDPASPPARLARIVTACEPRAILSGATHARLLAETLAVPGTPAPAVLGTLESAALSAPAGTRTFAADALDAVSTAAMAPAVGPDDPAHILFTSGSTGIPKGVILTQRNVLGFLDWAVPHFGFQAGDRHSSHPPLHFDLSTFDLFGAFTSGCELHLVPADTALHAGRLVEFMARSALTQWFSVPSVFNYVMSFDALRPDMLPALRRVLWCGEVLPTPTLAYWMERLPGVRFTNLYGPTEATIASTWYDVPAVPRELHVPVPIGRACGGEAVYVLDEALAPVPSGTIGEICLAGVGLSPGYWRDPEKTAAAFPALAGAPGGRVYRTGDLGRLDADGILHYCGRRDAQIKSRGYRIELGEIEAALATLPALQESAVVAVESPGFEGHVICCAYTPRAGEAPMPAALRKELQRLLPSYMLPSRWASFPALPRNQNGKVDRPRLRQHFLAEAGR
ncbi:MAG: amino acid adenylation domain-containing protein [Planctomycetes bacterium]|nr:amino acid adenylation domain-containing protein [Planctomycetota bacterium]